MTDRSPDDDLLLVDEFAAELRVSTKTVLRAIKAGKLKAARIGRGYRISRREGRRFIKTCMK